MDKKKPPQTPTMTPEEIFDAAVAEAGPNITKGGMDLLLSGLSAIKEGTKHSLNQRELCSIASLIAYAAYTQGVSEETIIAVLSAQFNVNEVQAIPRHLYNQAIFFLVDLEMDKIIN